MIFNRVSDKVFTSVAILLIAQLAAGCNYPPTTADEPAISSPTPTVLPILELTPTTELTEGQVRKQLALYPPSTRTGIDGLDLIIDAVLAHDTAALRDLTAYTEIGCTQADGLGGPPKCEPDEAEGTLVEVVPFWGPEGHHIRKDEFQVWPGVDVRGLIAAYRVSKDAYSEPSYPAGDFALIFLDADGLTDVTLQVRDAHVLRYDYAFNRSLPEALATAASEMVLPVPDWSASEDISWPTFDDPQGQFNFKIPSLFKVERDTAGGRWKIGQKIEIFTGTSDRYWLRCLEEPLGDCPIAEDVREVNINGILGTRIEGRFGSIGGRTPQEYLTYVFAIEDRYLIMTLYGAEIGFQSNDVIWVRPLDPFEVGLFEEIVASLKETR